MLRLILAQLAPVPPIDPTSGGGAIESYQLNPTTIDPISGGGNLESYQLDTIEIVGCFSYNLFVQPFKLINLIGCEIIDVVLAIIPQTPEQYHIGSILQNIATNSPLMWSLSGSVIGIIGPMLLIVASVKFWKIFKPF
ncbi:MAG: hypothetical protein WB539_00875 [Planktothrix agardhii]|uniref:hypothetical protein n=1 Tax=Planktothrix agardhii TaxID=1160 RepID=UPI003C5F5775